MCDSSHSEGETVPENRSALGNLHSNWCSSEEMNKSHIFQESISKHYFRNIQWMILLCFSHTGNTCVHHIHPPINIVYKFHEHQINDTKVIGERCKGMKIQYETRKQLELWICTADFNVISYLTYIL